MEKPYTQPSGVPEKSTKPDWKPSPSQTSISSGRALLRAMRANALPVLPRGLIESTLYAGSRVNLNQLARRLRCRHCQPLFHQAFKMQFNCLVDELHHLTTARCRSNTSRQIRNISAIAGRPAFNYHQVLHDSTSSLQSGLFQDTVERAWRDVNTRLPSHCYRTGLQWMMKLAVAALLSHFFPAVGLKQYYQVSYFDRHKGGAAKCVR